MKINRLKYIFLVYCYTIITNDKPSIKSNRVAITLIIKKEVNSDNTTSCSIRTEQSKKIIILVAFKILTRKDKN